MHKLLIVLVALVPATQALFFGGGGGGCGCGAPPACPPPPVCAPPPPPACPAPSPCGGGGYAAPAPAPIAYAQPAPVAYAPPQPIVAPPPVDSYARVGKREVRYENEVESTRVKREGTPAFDPKCNSEQLKEIIQKNIANTTAASKREIQKAATEQLGGRIDVICSTGTFSYIVNTELYCETENNGMTCFAFRQASA